MNEADGMEVTQSRWSGVDPNGAKEGGTTIKMKYTPL